MLKLIYIGLGGAFGAISRYSISRWMDIRCKSIFPYGTLVVNILGSFILGFLLTIFLDKTFISSNLKTAITTGFIGALTTFSTFAYEIVILFEKKNIFFAGLNVFANLFLGIIFVCIGIILARLTI